MATPRELLTERLKLALEETHPGMTPEVVPAADPRFGDYQSNVAMVLAKIDKTAPRNFAEQILRNLDVQDICEPPEVAGAGFINFRLTTRFLALGVAAIFRDSRLGVSVAKDRERIIIDFSSPNVAKPMHVGHIRSTILGDCLARIARVLGHEVITDNHIGDWGTQFGKVIYGWKHFLDEEALEKNAIAELVRLYRKVNTLEETDDAIRRAAREELVKLQLGDAENMAIWRRTVELSWREFEKLYDLLDIHFDERLGESFYNDALAPLCDRLTAGGSSGDERGSPLRLFPRHSLSGGQTGHYSQERRWISICHNRSRNDRLPRQEMEPFGNMVRRGRPAVPAFSTDFRRGATHRCDLKPPAHRLRKHPRG